MVSRKRGGLRGEGEGDERPLHVGFYSPALPDSGNPNGIVTYVRIMRDALRSLGHKVTVVTLEQIIHSDGTVANLPLPSRLQVLRERMRGKDASHPYVRARVFNAFRAAQRAGVDVFEIEESFGWAGSLAGHGLAIVERLHGPHLFMRDRGTPEQQRLSNQREAAERASFERVQAITSPTQRLLDSLVERCGLQLRLARIIPNPIPVLPDEQWSIDQANPDQVLCVGRFDLVKGADVVVRAFAQALRERPTLSLAMVGPDPGLAKPDGSVVHFEEFAAEEIPTEARARIHFLGTQTPQQIARMRLQSGLCLIGSRFENFPYSVAEAMAVGMPIIATDTFGGGEMIRDGQDGLIVPIDSVELMAAALLDATKNRARALKMARSARMRAAKWLSPARVARETVAIYCDAIARLHSARE